MKHLFVPYELALIAKEKGFNEECFGFHETKSTITFFDTEYGSIKEPKEKDGLSINAPLYQQLIDWFRDKAIRIIEKPEFGWNVMVEYDGGYITYKELFTLDEALEEAFKLI